MTTHDAPTHATDADWSPFSAQLALQAVWTTLAGARRGETTDGQLKLAQGVLELVGAWLERLEGDEP
jgi:hypothetical protein